MPRKENLSIEERLERAQELYDKKLQAKRKEISNLYNTSIYKLAKKSCIVFLWISQLILIDWMLPYLKTPDVISDGYRVNYSKINKHAATEFFVTIRTKQYKKIELYLEKEDIEPLLNDSVIIYKSLLLHEPKKVLDINRNATYLVSNSITYFFLPLIIISSILCLLFLFIRNIEVKAFYYFMFISNIAAVFTLIFYYLY